MTPSEDLVKISRLLCLEQKHLAEQELNMQALFCHLVEQAHCYLTEIRSHAAGKDIAAISLPAHGTGKSRPHH
jgi:hypothetical protein